MKAVIMAGGEGSRLRPLTCDRPKPMVPIMNRPTMEYIVELLKKYGITDIGITLHYMPSAVTEYFGDGSDFGVSLTYFTEKEPLGTAGSVKNCGDFLDETFLVISGDALTDIDLKKALDYHREKQAEATLILSRVELPLEYGVVMTDPEGKITGFVEKPTWSEVFSDTVNTGIYILEPGVMERVPENTVYDFSKNVFPVLLEDKVPLYGYITHEYWCDIGDLSAYRQCHFDIFNHQVKLHLHGKEIEQNIFVEDGVQVDDSALLVPPLYIGRGAQVGPYAKVESFSVLGTDCHVGSHSQIKRSILFEHNRIGSFCEIKGSVLCSNIIYKDRALSFEQSVIGDHTVLGENSMVKPNVKIWPYKEIQDDTTISTNLIWGSSVQKSLFEDSRICGESNVDITPDFAVRLGQSVCWAAEKPVKIAAATDGHPASQMLQKAIVAGVLSCGGQIYHAGTQCIPVVREAVALYQLGGGIHVGSSMEKGILRTTITLMGKQGMDYGKGEKRKVEGLVARGDFLSCSGHEVKGTVDISHIAADYKNGVKESLQYAGPVLRILCSVADEKEAAFLKEIFQGSNWNLEFRYGGADRKEGFASEVAAGQFDLGVLFEHHFEGLTLIGPDARIFTKEELLYLLVTILNHRRERIVMELPPALPAALNLLIQENKKAEGFSQPADFRRQQHLLHDGIKLLVLLLNELKTTFEDLAQEIPRFYLSAVQTPVSSHGKGRIIKQIVDADDAKMVKLDRGVKIYKDGGWVYLIPEEKQNSYRIISEGYNQEYADDLTEFYRNKVKDFDES